MTEATRTRIYNWLSEQTDEQLAEYLMSCLSPAPLADLATKADILAMKAELQLDVRCLDARVDQLETRMDRLEARMDRLEALREADLKEHAAQRAADRAQSRRQFAWLMGAVTALFTANTSVVVGAILFI